MNNIEEFGSFTAPFSGVFLFEYENDSKGMSFLEEGETFVFEKKPISGCMINRCTKEEFESYMRDGAFNVMKDYLSSCKGSAGDV